MSADVSVFQIGTSVSSWTEPPKLKSYRMAPDNSARRPPKNPRDLIGFLLAHGARARRAARPHCAIALQVLSPSGDSAVEISFD